MNEKEILSMIREEMNDASDKYCKHIIAWAAVLTAICVILILTGYKLDILSAAVGFIIGSAVIKMLKGIEFLLYCQKAVKNIETGNVELRTDYNVHDD